MKYFWQKTNGKNADLKRHTEEERKLTAEIAELEQKLKIAKDSLEMDEAYLKAKKYFLCELQKSKAELASSLFKKKDS